MTHKGTPPNKRKNIIISIIASILFLSFPEHKRHYDKEAGCPH